MARNKLPELLAPAGSYKALEAAVSAGADAVYFGAQSFNARAGAENFADDEIAEAIKYLKLLGVKSNITMNTSLFAGELTDALGAAEKVLSAGADAIITADLGLAALIKRHFPDAELHASTQCVGENIRSAAELSKLGFSRMVASREISFEDLKTLCARSPIETEIFVHGALCVSHSGACLMSAMIGGRSGNRGECAQPCRLPYKCRGCEYPLSLKDLSLSGHITDILPLGVASLKIEGRMKSPEYVAGVVSVFRKLLDERRNATDDEVEYLSRLFSRSGFTDGYFTGNVTSSMLGTRTESDKREAKNIENTSFPKRKVPIDITASLHKGEPMKLSATLMREGKEYRAEVSGEEPSAALTSPLTAERVRENLNKLGATVFTANSVVLEMDENINLPISAVNGARRALTEALEAQILGEKTEKHGKFSLDVFGTAYSHEKSAYFVYGENITKSALDYFDRIFVPFDEYIKNGLCEYKNVGVAFTPVAFDGELEKIAENAKKCRELGANDALITNIWQFTIAKELGFTLHGDMRLNVWNPYSAAFYEREGLSTLVLSPEVTLSKAERVGGNIPHGYIAYGRLPLMTTEKCVIREINGIRAPREKCAYCDTHAFSYLKDRTDALFPVVREGYHRNVIFNSVPVYMLDKASEKMFSHFIFTDETCKKVDAIIAAARERSAPQGKFRRI